MPVYEFVHETVALPFPGVAVTPVGAVGAVAPPGTVIVWVAVVLPLDDTAVTIT